MLLLFLYGVIHLFVLRFKTGDVYPAYSSLRSDPLGTRAFFESLENLDNFSVRRNYQPLRVSQVESETTILVLGAQIEDWKRVSKESAKVLDRLMDTGGRLIISFLPVYEMVDESEKSGSAQKRISESDESRRQPNCSVGDSGVAEDNEIAGEEKQDSTGGSENQSKQQQGDPASDADSVNKRFISIRKHWGLGYEINEAIQSSDESPPDLFARPETVDYPDVITWHTNVFFDVHDSDWRIIYSCEGLPVIIERQFGRGSVVMSTDSFFFSNEALRSERHPELLSGVVGPNRKIVFDEMHFGIVKRPGVAILIRKFKFQWFFAGLILLAFLFVWKNSVYFVPPNTGGGLNEKDVRSDKDYTQGFVALLRRNIPAGELLKVCIREWKESAKADRRISGRKWDHIKAVLKKDSDLAKKEKDPVGEYQKISSIIAKENKYE